MRKFQASVEGESRAKFVAARIVEASQWFEFTPLPAGKYEFVVKTENGGMLREHIQAAYDAEPLDVWGVLDAANKLNTLQNESTVEVGLLLEDGALVKMILEGESKEACLAHINENF